MKDVITSSRIGLISGKGKFPIILAQEAKRRGMKVVAIALKEATNAELEKYVDKIYWISIGEIGKGLDILVKEELKEVFMVGKVEKSLLFKNISRDGMISNLIKSTADRLDNTLLKAVSNKLAELNIELLDSTILIRSLLPQRGILTERKPTQAELGDINFGQKIAKSIATLYIGQTVIVKDKAVLAVEAIDGTDQTIKRAGMYCKSGIVMVKVSWPNQDMRLDVPTIGPDTIKLLKEVNASAIAIEAQKTIILDIGESVNMANSAGICMVAF